MLPYFPIDLVADERRDGLGRNINSLDPTGHYGVVSRLRAVSMLHSVLLYLKIDIWAKI